MGQNERVSHNAEWQPIETAPKDGTDILLFTKTYGITQAWFHAGEWSEDTPISPAEYTGDMWVCADDTFQIEVEFGPNGYEYHNEATHWMPLPPPPKDLEADDG